MRRPGYSDLVAEIRTYNIVVANQLKPYSKGNTAIPLSYILTSRALVLHLQKMMQYILW